MKTTIFRIFRALLRQVRRNSGRPFARCLKSVACETLRATYNASYDFETNGELRALEIALAAAPPRPIVFDVGANVGDWSRQAAKLLPADGRIHAFEPTAASFARLTAKLADTPCVTPHRFGLSDADATLEMDVSDTRSQKSALVSSGAQGLNSAVDDYRRESCSFVRGAGFCATHEIAQIAFLKIDTEGHDLWVLKGFANMLAGRRIAVVQFEYNQLNVRSRSFLRDFYELLEAHYAIGRIYPSSVDFKAYDGLDENFIDGNFIAVSRDLPDLRSRLAGA